MFRNRGRSRILGARNSVSPSFTSAATNSLSIEAQSSGAPLNEWECQNREAIANNVSASAIVHNGENTAQNPHLNSRNLHGHRNERDENVLDDDGDDEASEKDSTVSILGSVIEDDVDLTRWKSMKRASRTAERVADETHDAEDEKVVDPDISRSKNSDELPFDVSCDLLEDRPILAQTLSQSSLKAPKEGSNDNAHNDFDDRTITDDRIADSNNIHTMKNFEEQPEGTSHEHADNVQLSKSLPQSIVEAAIQQEDGILRDEHNEQFTKKTADVDTDEGIFKQPEDVTYKRPDNTLQSEQSAPRSISNATHSNIHVVQVADFSKMSGDSDITAETKSTKHLKEGTMIHRERDTPNNHRSPLSYQSSPFRKAFRFEHNRRPATPRLPSRMEGRALLPWQLASKCFSFDDTTNDDTMPYQYYGRSAASFPCEQTVVPLHRTNSFSDGSRRRQLEEEDHSTFHVQRSKTWDCQFDGRNNREKAYYLQSERNSPSQPNLMNWIQRRQLEVSVSQSYGRFI